MQAVTSRLASLDRRAAWRLARVAKPPRWFRLWMVWASRSGDGWLWYLAGVSVLMAGGKPRFLAFYSALGAAIAGVGLFTWLKRRIGRPRPADRQVWALVTVPDRFSFPSGHTITAFAVALDLGRFYPHLLPFLCFAAASVGVSRVVLGVHYLTDVLAGAAIGSLLGAGASWVASMV